MELSLFHFDVEMRTDCSILCLLNREHSSSADTSGVCKLAFFPQHFTDSSLKPAIYGVLLKMKLYKNQVLWSLSPAPSRPR